MKILTCIVVHDRPELTERTIGSYLATTTETPKLLVAYDSGSNPETAWALEAWRRAGAFVIRSDENVYPGRGCNEAWTHALNLADDVTLLHRSDNDVEYQPGWWEHVVERFEDDPRLGQLGLLEERFEQGCFNVGGNCVLRRELWDGGLRWDETRWGENPAGAALNEDALMSSAVAAAGYQVGRVSRECVVHLGWDFDDYPGYYEASARVRGYDPDWLRGHFDRMRAL